MKSFTKTLARPSFQRFSGKSLVITLILATAYIMWVVGVLGLTADRVYLLLGSLALYYFHPTTRRLFLAFSVWIFYWIIFDSMKVFPNYLFNPVSVQEPYEVEKALFGIQTSMGVITPNQFFKMNQHPIMDLIAGFFYLNWVPVPIALAVYFWMKDKMAFLRFSHAFLLTNLIGFIIYYNYPAAPPWYLDLYGFTVHLNTPSNAAELVRFDAFFGIPIFESMYTKGSNVFAAIPSLHSAFPVIVLYYGMERKLGWVNILFVIFAFGIWFAAVYSNHHYIIDVILGACCALLGIAIFEKILLRNKKVKQLLLGHARVI